MSAVITNPRPISPEQAAQSKKRVRGWVKSWKTEGNFGFIRVEGWPDVFVHFSAIDGFNADRKLNPGQFVEFTPDKTDKGYQALDVKVVRP